MRLRNLQIKIIVIVLLTVAFSGRAMAIERAGYLGQTWSFPLFLTPSHSSKEVTYHFDMSYFLHEKWTADLSLNTQMDGLRYFYLELGPDFYPIQDVIILPFVSARFLYTMLPSGHPGWMSQIGFETHIAKSNEIENLRLRFSAGAGEFLMDPENQFFIELARIGLIWSF